MDPLTIRAARPEERTLLEALQRRASLENAGDREALLVHPDAIALPVEQIAAGGVIVAERLGRIVGFAALLTREHHDRELDALFVDPSAWRQGVGQALVEHCVDLARRQGSAAIHVVANPHAEGFYRACGFEMVGTTTTRFGAALTYRKAIAPLRTGMPRD